eukprot:304046-Pleurochrysis_carterae.AAC.1
MNREMNSEGSEEREHEEEGRRRGREIGRRLLRGSACVGKSAGRPAHAARLKVVRTPCPPASLPRASAQRRSRCLPSSCCRRERPSQARIPFRTRGLRPVGKCAAVVDD